MDTNNYFRKITLRNVFMSKNNNSFIRPRVQTRAMTFYIKQLMKMLFVTKCKGTKGVQGSKVQTIFIHLVFIS